MANFVKRLTAVPLMTLRKVLKSSLKIKTHLRLSCASLVDIGNSNIKSMTDKFYQLKEIVPNCVIILLITETKLFDSFPGTQFLVYEYFNPLCLDRK